ncbi:MAG: type II secretion system protein GspD [Verrucomicrobiota bacterium]
MMKIGMREEYKFLNGWLTFLTTLALVAATPIFTAHARVNSEVVLYTADETGLLLTEEEDFDEDEGEDSDVVVLPELSGGTGDNAIINNMTLGDFIVDERQMLYQTRMVDAEFLDAPVIEVLRGLAEASDINYVLPKIDSDTISIRLRMPAFKALELIAHDAGMEVIKEKDLWFIRKKDKEALVAKTYKLQHIHLGLSGGGNAAGGDEDRTFGSASYSDIGGDSSNNNNNNDNNNNNSSNNNNDSNTSSTSQTGSNLSQVNSESNFTTLGDVQDRLAQSSDVLDTIREILGIAERNRLTSQTGQTGEEGRTEDQASNESFVSYNAESNTLYVIATEHQHHWVEKYLDVVDKAVNNIAIDAIFIESELNPTESLGVSWENVASGYTFRAGQGTSTTAMAYNVLENPVLPTGVILESDALEATVRAWMSENKSRVARYPRVVTANNQQVKIQTTTNIPVISQVSTTATTGATDTSSTSTTDDSGTTTNFTASTQQIGTIINIVPQQINDEVILLKIGIEISAADASTSGETRTGRVTTNATLYEGEVRVPSGKTLAIGGLERIAESSNIRRIPWLSEIPIFGFLFKDKSKDFSRTNITLLLTPTILADTEAKSLMPSQFRDTKDERIMEDLDAVETQSIDKTRIYRKR